MDAGVAAGLQLFVRYAYPPNLRGYCGPADSLALRDYGAARVSDPGLEQLARGFAGPWPYLKVIAAGSGISDPFDQRVVEAYWVGNELLNRVDPSLFAAVLEEHVRHRAGRDWTRFATSAGAGAVPHHGFHVFEVYPWVGLLLESGRGEPLDVLQGCRIRWGRVIDIQGDVVVVNSRPLTWDGRRFDLGPGQPEQVRWSADGYAFIDSPQVGDWVSMHWEWVCDRLNERSCHTLATVTQRQLASINAALGERGPARAIG
jgi:hypothetical protein